MRLDLKNLSPLQMVIGLGFVTLIGVLVYVLVLVLVIGKDTQNKDVPTLTSTPTSTPIRANIIDNIPNVPADLREVYYSDNGGSSSGSNPSRYAFTFAQAQQHATERGGVLATPEQLNDANRRGLDVCWLGWASDSKVYTAAQNVGSGCEGENLGVKLRPNITKAGAWIYGIKPTLTNIANCKNPGVVSSCVLPFSTITNKWSQYS